MVWIPEGGFLMGSEDFYPEERPVHRVEVDGFWIDEHPVTVAEFRRFVKATGYVTWAEKAPDPADYPDAMPELMVPGSIVFTGSTGPVDLSDTYNWWSWIPGAQWRHPEGPESTLHGRERHPVTHVAHQDACAYAAWAGKELPTEAEWEYASRGGLEAKTFTWGDEFAPKGKMMANTWQGEFPWQNTLLDRYERTSPVRASPRTGTASTTWPATSGNGPTTSSRPPTPRESTGRAAHRATPVRRQSIAATARTASATTSPAGSPKAAPTSAPRITASVTDPQPDRASLSTARRATSGSAASPAPDAATTFRTVTRPSRTRRDGLDPGACQRVGARSVRLSSQRAVRA